ncbi:MAG TPA: signal peptidase II [Syntrophomonadaceae bacterium]|nr:signal peptidase II [Syntrophomonadaceae bacterium]
MRFWWTAALLVGLDQFTKWLVKVNMMPGESFPVAPGFLYLTYVQNRGAAFSLMSGQRIFLLLTATLVVLAVVIFNQRYKPNVILQMITGLLAGGALGNLIDRINLGYVVDFLDLGWFPVFNLADSAICIAAFLFIIVSLREETE